MKFNTILNQILQFLPQAEFDKAIKALKTDRYVKYFKTKTLFGLHLYAQIRQKDSLRDIKQIPFCKSFEDYNRLLPWNFKES